ncbi:MAG TPA: DegQ family serine endoprotease [Stellaceae bacterium]|nr:DegQ family serine endoprotease [Stellaceae bacterium]
MRLEISPRLATGAAFRRVRALALATSVGLALAPAAWAQTASPAPLLQPQAPGSALPSFAPLVKKVLPAVVNISVTERANAPDGDEDQDADADTPGGGPQGTPGSPFDEFLRKFFEQQGPGRGNPLRPSPGAQRLALGSGFIIDPAGYVVTNGHVVANADKVTVVLQDNSKYQAKVIGRDSKTDLGLLKIDAKQPLPYVSWGDSGAMQVGDWVLAVGNPFGLGGTVSSGIISARGRDIHSGPYDDFLQLDAAINRGNSGGPTFNLQGQVIGINTAIYSPNGGSVGIGFAIPAALAKPVIDQLREHGKVERGWLGVQIQEVTPEIAKSLGLPKPEGALVADVTKGSPAAKAGFKQGDVITSFNGHAIQKVRDLPIIVAQTPIGQKAKVEVWRSGRETPLDVAIGQMPDNPQVAKNEQQGGDQTQQGTAETPTALGLKLAPLNSEMRKRAGVPKEVKGVVVTAVADDSPLAEIGVQPGDVIQQINQQPVTSPQQAEAKLKEAQAEKSKNLLLLVNRRGTNQYLALSMNKGDNG